MSFISNRFCFCREPHDLSRSSPVFASAAAIAPSPLPGSGSSTASLTLPERLAAEGLSAVDMTSHPYADAFLDEVPIDPADIGSLDLSRRVIELRLDRVSEYLSRCSRLRELRINGCADLRTAWLVDTLKTLPSLTALDAADSSLSDTVLKEIGTLFALCCVVVWFCVCVCICRCGLLVGFATALTVSSFFDLPVC